MSLRSAREIQAALLQTGDITGEMLTGVTALAKDFAAATGQDAAGAARQLGAAFADPITGAEDLAAKYGVLSQAQVEQIGHLVEQNDLTGAQKVLLDALGPAFGGAADQANVLARGWENIGNAAAGAWNWMGKALDRMASGGALQDRIADLQKVREQGPTLTMRLMGSTDENFRAGIDKQIAALRYQMRQEGARSARDQANSAQAKGQALADTYTGGTQLGQYQKNIGTLRAALATQMPPEQRKALTETLQAYTHAVETFIPKADKANQIAAIDAKIAATKSPAAKAALAADKARLELAGQVVTSADAETRAHSAGDRARSSATKSGDKHAASLARQAQSMEVSAAAALDVADAYLKSSSAGLLAEARRKAATDATKKGIDVEAQARRQLNLQIAEGAAAGAKSVATLNDETDARAKVNAAVADGSISVDTLNQAISDQAALRPLIALRDAAEGDAKTKLTAIIDAYTAALARSHREEANSGATSAIADSERRTADIAASILDLSKSPREQALAAARRAAEREADAAGYKDTDKGAFRTDFINGKVKEADANQATDRARFILDGRQAQEDQLALSQRELELVGASADVRSRELEKLRIEQDIRKLFPEMSSIDIENRLRGVDAQDAINAKLKITAAAIDEVRGYGAEFADTVLSPDTWSSWGNAGKTVLNSLKNEFIKLALLNPLKNLISGNSDLPTLSSTIGSIGKLFGGKGIGKNATGTESWSGGLTYVNENGGEIMDLPGGTRIYPAAESRRMMAANDAGFGRMAVDINLNTDLFTASVSRISGSQLQAAAPGIAAGAVRISGAQDAKRRRRRLPGG